MNDMNKKCIFHIPMQIDLEGKTGSNLRPRKMIQAFRNIGYEVDVVMGYGAERKKAIDEIKKKIKSGVKYQFIYSESSTMPTLLTEKKHIPTHPFLDFSFFSFCKKNDIPIGLFYRDIYWKFPMYKDSVHGIKYLVAQLMYRYDLLWYCKLLSKFFVPSIGMMRYVRKGELNDMAWPLPPGAEYNKEKIQSKDRIISDYTDGSEKNLLLFYVGGIGEHYKFEKLLMGIKDLNYVNLVVCCIKEQWENSKQEYKRYLTDRVKIIHEYGQGLEPYYEKAMIGIAFFEQDEYRKMAMPIKVFEYMGHGLPIIASKGTAAGDFIENNAIGWELEYDETTIRKLLVDIHENPGKLYKKHQNVVNVLIDNTWESRAKTVEEQLLQKK